jgi:DNA-binding LacI/PurR family transcriptional regulator
MSEIPPVPQRAVAEHLGLSQATVSMALAGHPRIPEETRARILAAAEELGYRPNPALRSLARYRKAVREPSYQSTLAWVHALGAAEAWKTAVYGEFFTAAQNRAERLGYKLENFWVQPGVISDARASQILSGRGIRGLLVLPHSNPGHEMALDWERFSTVRMIDYTNKSPALHVVASDHYASMLHVLDHVAKRGYKRPGLITSHAFENRMLQNYSAAYLGASSRIEWPSIFWSDQPDETAFGAWLQQERPDVLLISYAVEFYEKIFEWVNKFGLKAPKDIGLVTLCMPDRNYLSSKFPDISGIDEQLPMLAARSVDFLVHLIENFETGVPSLPMRHLMQGKWHEGTTVRPIKS